MKMSQLIQIRFASLLMSPRCSQHFSKEEMSIPENLALDEDGDEAEALSSDDGTIHENSIVASSNFFQKMSPTNQRKLKIPQKIPKHRFWVRGS